MKTPNALLSFFLSLLFCACNSADDPDAWSIANPKGDVVEWSLQLNLPDEPRTRAAGSVTAGSDGLYFFPRDINKLWYAVYYNDEFIYDSSNPEAQQPVLVGDKFNLVFKLPRIYDPTKVKLFCWAGNADDKVTTDNVISVSDGINLNFRERCVSLSPKYLNGNGAIAEYDSFYGYFQLSPSTDVSSFSPKFTLKRPFAQIHILSNELIDSDSKDSFADGIIISQGLGKNNSDNTFNLNNDYKLPTTWFYDNSKTLNPAYKTNEFIFSQSDYEYTTSLADGFPYTVNFGEKGKYHCLGCMLMLMPSATTSSPNDKNIESFSVLNVLIRFPGESLNEASTMSIIKPSDGFKANNRYVIYNTNEPDPNKPVKPGFLTDTYEFVISADPNWTGTIEDSK